MREFVELQGASGASYRFRLWRDGDVHLPVAGNYVVVRPAADGFAILALDVSDDLSLVSKTLKRATRDQPAHQIYTRLNVARAVRMAENDDIAAAIKPRRATRPTEDEDSTFSADNLGA
jgi:hypothetical protein